MPSEPTSFFPFLEALERRSQPVPPLWLMRQAGRYLPEYRSLRAKAGSFEAMMGNPDHACEVTLQPLRRFGFDAAILFSDILTIPAALGQDLRFEDGRGPVLGEIPSLPATLAEFGEEKFQKKLACVYETLGLLREALPREGFGQTALIGFSGAPWTLACYMVERGGSKEFAATRTLAYADPAGFDALIGLLSEACVAYLSRQIEAGAQAVQIFDSWAGVLPPAQFRRYVTQPTARIVAALNARHPGVKIIGFPRGAGTLAGEYARKTGITALGVDEQTPLADLRETEIPLQGNLDPFVLRAGGPALERAVDEILLTMQGRPFIFNLGHGINKDTPPEHVAALVARVRAQG